MEYLFGLLIVLGGFIHLWQAGGLSWRRAIGIVMIPLVLAIIARYLLQPLSDSAFVFIVTTGFVLALFWGQFSHDGKNSSVVLSRPVEALSLWFFGIVYGSMLAGILGSETAAMFAIGLSVFVGAGWHRYKSQQRAVGYYIYAASLMIAGFGSLLFFFGRV